MKLNYETVYDYFDEAHCPVCGHRGLITCDFPRSTEHNLDMINEWDDVGCTECGTRFDVQWHYQLESIAFLNPTYDENLED